MSVSSWEEVMTTTGITFNRSSALIWRRTSNPSTFGIFRSRRITTGSSPKRSRYLTRRKRKSSASAPSRRATTSLVRPFSASAASASSVSCGLSSTNRMPLRSFINRSLFRRRLQRKVESGALIEFGIRPRAAAMAGNDSTNDRKANASTLEFVGPM